MTHWSRGLPRSRDKLRLLHLHYHSVYGHQTWQDGDLPDALLSKKPDDLFSMWSFKIMCQTKTIISPLLQCLWPPKLAVTLRSSKLMNLQLSGLTKSPGKLKSLYLPAAESMTAKRGRVVTYLVTLPHKTPYGSWVT